MSMSKAFTLHDFSYMRGLRGRIYTVERNLSDRIIHIDSLDNDRAYLEAVGCQSSEQY